MDYVLSTITGNRRGWGRWEGGGDKKKQTKNWKVMCAASRFFSGTHRGRFCWLIRASRSLSGKKETLTVGASGVFFLSLEVCRPEFCCKKSKRCWMTSSSSAYQYKGLWSDLAPPNPKSPARPRSFRLALQPRADHQTQRIVAPPQKTRPPPTLPAIVEPPHRVEIKFCFHSWLVGGTRPS